MLSKLSYVHVGACSLGQQDLLLLWSTAHTTHAHNLSILMPNIVQHAVVPQAGVSLHMECVVLLLGFLHIPQLFSNHSSVCQNLE